MIRGSLIKSTAIELLRLASIYLPNDVKESLKSAYNAERDEVARMQLKAILNNISLAEEKNIPLCQDTGLHVFYADLGSVQVEDFEDSINEAVSEATKTIPLRPNAVYPFSRKNSGTNLGQHVPYINYKISDQPFVEITVMPKGAGSENMSSLAMLTPTQGISGVKEFILNCVMKAGGNPCPPNILGIGVGGSSDIAMKIAKEALLRPLNDRNSDPEIAELETDILEAVNKLGIGPMGLGGDSTLLGVKVELAHCHTATLPVALNYQCWAARRASARIYESGNVEFLSHKLSK